MSTYTMTSIQSCDEPLAKFKNGEKTEIKSTQNAKDRLLFCKCTC